MTLALLQPSLPFVPCPIAAAVADMSEAEDKERGAVFTRREIVDFILDLVGYRVDLALHRFRLLEPSFGHGDFLLPAVERLLDSYRGDDIVADLSQAIRAVEVHRGSVAATAEKIRTLICSRGHRPDDADKLLAAWIVHDDFLLCELLPGFTHVVGNPPYLRQEAISAPLLAEYRRRYRTIYDRADLYIPFFERSLTLLAQGGALGFICSDRWMKNRYGGPLRAMVARDFHVDIYVDMVDTPAFHSEVIAYPAITVISRAKSGVTRLVSRPAVDRQGLSDLARVLRRESPSQDDVVTEVPSIARGDEPWMLNASSQLALVRRLEAEFPTLDEAGCKVGIGVATGADGVFIGRFEDLDVEPTRKLPLVTTKDICGGSVVWQGLGVLNPFDEAGGVVDLTQFPRFAHYLSRHAEVIRRRNVAQRNPAAWYRTIDRITPDLATCPKLLIPDIKGEAHVVFEEGRYYPHHNLYYIISDAWNLRALQAVLLSGIAKLFVAAYSVKMRGGHLRFQAQYLRRIRLPRWHDIEASQREALVEAAELGDRALCNRLVFDAFGLTQAEREILVGG